MERGRGERSLVVEGLSGLSVLSGGGAKFRTGRRPQAGGQARTDLAVPCEADDGECWLQPPVLEDVGEVPTEPRKGGEARWTV